MLCALMLCCFAVVGAVQVVIGCVMSLLYIYICRDICCVSVGVALCCLWLSVAVCGVVVALHVLLFDVLLIDVWWLVCCGVVWCAVVGVGG